MTFVKDVYDEQKKRKSKKVFIGVIALIVATLILFTGIKVYGNYKEEKFLKSVKLEQIKVTPKEIKHTSTDIFQETYQKEAKKQVDALKKKKEYTEKNPLVIKNPYGTNTTSLYVYAKTTRAAYVVATVEVSGGSKIKNTLKNGKKSKYQTTHEYQIIGLAAGEKNKITLEFYNENHRAIAKKYFYIDMPEDSVIPKVLKKNIGNSKVEMSQGLFALLGHDKAQDSHIYLYDNEGINRGRMPLNHYRTDRLLFIGDEMVYSYDYNKIAFVNRLGSVTRTIDIGNYEFHHDFIYNKKYNKIVCLVNDKKKDTIEDVAIVVDVKSGKVDQVIDFEDYLGTMKKLAYRPKKNTYGGTGLDWIHLNSLDFIDDDSMIFSSREQSTLIKLSDIFEKPKLDYLIHGGSVYGNTEYASYLLKKVGSFVSQAGQHTITVERDKSLPKGQYYLYMFNNDYGNTSTIPDFDWSTYSGVGSFEKGTSSQYYKYLVDEKKGTYELVKSIDLPYSSIVSSVQHLGGNIPFSSGMSKTFGEYDTSGKMIRSFEYEADKYSYRVMKYNFMGYLYR